MSCIARMPRWGALTLALICATASAADPALEARGDLPLELDTVVATRGEAVLTVGEIDAKVRSMPPDIRGGYLTDPGRVSKLIDSMLLAEQIAVEAEKAGLAETVEFNGDMALLRTELLSRVGMQRHMEQFELPDLEQLAQETYLAAPESYRPPGQIDLRHILISVDDKDDDAAARETATRIYERAKAGEDFGTLVEEFMPANGEVDKSLIVNADLSRLDPQFAAALKGLHKDGDIVGPVRSRYGWHVVRLQRKVVHPVPSFEEVKPRIIEQLRGQVEQAERSRYMRGHSSQPVELSGDVIRALPARYIDQGETAAEPTAGD